MPKKKLDQPEEAPKKETKQAPVIPQMTAEQREYLRVVYELAIDHVNEIHSDVKSFVHIYIDGKTYGFSTKNMNTAQLAKAHEAAAKELKKVAADRLKEEKKFKVHMAKLRKQFASEKKSDLKKNKEMLKKCKAV